MPGKDQTMDTGPAPPVMCCPLDGQPSSEIRVPIIDVHKENFTSLYPSILLAIKNSSFIALDTELSGLGDRRSIIAHSVEDRYKSMSIAARSRSIVSMGLSCFKLKKTQTSPSDVMEETEALPERKSSIWNYMVQTFNITLLCHDDYTVEPKSLQFLVDHGFDLNKQCLKGILYFRGNDKKHKDVKHPSIRDIFTEILLANVPVILHNAIIDLIFLHQNLYCDLPFKLNSFLCNLSEMFAAGIYDTKFLAEYYMRTPATYLQYVFKKCLRQAMKTEPKKNLLLSFLDYPKNFSYVKYHNLGHRSQRSTQFTLTQLKELVCERFAAYGWCQKGRNCPKSHNIELILDLDEAKPTKTQRRKDRKRKREEQKLIDNQKIAKTNSETEDQAIEESEKDVQDNCEGLVSSFMDEDNDSKDSSLTSEETEAQLVTKTETVDTSSDTSEMVLDTEIVNEAHMAGFDAFMTGYVFATAIAQISGATVDDKLNICGGQLPVWINKIYLAGKDLPLAVAKSKFSNVSNYHKEKLKQLKDQNNKVDG